MLRIAAVGGREFSHDLLAAATEFDDDRLLELVDEALRAAVIEETVSMRSCARVCLGAGW